MSQQETPVIVLPGNPSRVAALRAKLEEYRHRLDPWKHPGLQMDTWMKIEVLERLLTEGSVKTWELSRELAKKYDNSFSASAFENACAVIEDYCKTGDANTVGGTRLGN